MPGDTVFLFTTAPEAYDGFSTHRMVEVGSYCGNSVWQLSIEPRDVEWQRGRNGSGMYCTWTEDEWIRSVKHGSGKELTT